MVWDNVVCCFVVGCLGLYLSVWAVRKGWVGGGGGGGGRGGGEGERGGGGGGGGEGKEGELFSGWRKD